MITSCEHLRLVERHTLTSRKRAYWSKLSLAGMLTIFACVGYFLAFQNRAVFKVYRCWVAAPAWRHCSSHTPFQFTTDFFGMRYEGNTNNLVDFDILFFGAYEKPILYFLRDVMKASSPNGGVFLDVGANTGQYSLFMSRYANEVHAFEPYEPVLQRFRRMVEINHLQNIKIYPLGLGNKNEKLPFFKPPELNQGAGSFIEGFYPGNTNYKELEIVVGDEVLEKAGLRRVDLIKIDVEGYEKPVLQGLVRTLTTSRSIVDFELTVNPAAPLNFRRREEIFSVFPKDYKFLVFSDGDPYTGFYELRDMDPAIDFDSAAQYNVVAYPAEKEHQVPRRSSR